MNCSNQIKNSRGFTLVEIVVLLIVAAIILPALILPFVEGVRDFNQPVVQGTLAFLAQEEMESKIICQDYDDISPWSSTEIDGFPGYSSSCTVEVIETGTKRIIVTVTEGGQSIELETIKTDWN